ncbi:MAG TPA: signal peptidase II [Planctomycetota bacterium]|nr:signal peptidase II [Planctomycetota bacterium]
MTPAPPAAGTEHGASKAWFWLPIAPLVALDLWTKAAVFAFLDERYPGQGVAARHEIFDGLVRLELVRWHNPGTIWGLFQGYNLPLVVLRCVAVVLIVGYVVRLQRASRGLLLVLGAILAGALGNLYDNFTEQGGGVRDFLYFTFFPSGWNKDFPAFNVADACISLGVCYLVLSILFDGGKSAAAGRAAPVAHGGP